MNWKFNKNCGNYVFSTEKNIKRVWLSYRENNDIPLALKSFNEISLDSANPETAIVVVGDKKDGRNRYLIFRGDHRKELEKIYPNIKKLKKYWSENGGHFWSDDLED